VLLFFLGQGWGQGCAPNERSDGCFLLQEGVKIKEEEVNLLLVSCSGPAFSEDASQSADLIRLAMSTHLRREKLYDMICSLHKHRSIGTLGERWVERFFSIGAHCNYGYNPQRRTCSAPDNSGEDNSCVLAAGQKNHR
jgi:hypothetical protein